MGARAKHRQKLQLNQAVAEDSARVDDLLTLHVSSFSRAQVHVSDSVGDLSAQTAELGAGGDNSTDQSILYALRSPHLAWEWA